MRTTTRARGNRRLFPVIALMVALMTVLWQGSALAGLGDAKTPQTGTSADSSGDSGAPSSDPAPAAEPAPADADTADANVTTSKSAPAAKNLQDEAEAEVTGGAHAEATVLHVGIGEQEIITISHSEADARDDSCAAGGAAISILGALELGGTDDAECTAGQEVNNEGSLLSTCEPSGGALCIALLYGRATTSDNADQTSSSSQHDVLNVCVGGEQTSPSQDCTGNTIGARVAHSEAGASRNKKDGAAHAEQENSLVELCIGGTNPETGACDGLGLILLHSESSGDARPGADGEFTGDAYILAIDQGGERTVVPVGDSEGDLPPGCSDDPEGPGSLCAALNDSDVSVEAGKGSGHDQVITLDVGDVIVGDVDNGVIEADSTKVKAEKVKPPAPPKPPKKEKPKKKAPTLAGPAGPALATTGASVIPALVLAFALILLGARLVRRPAVVRE
ncbi:MAG TPA: hypothetical protein VNC78_09340 [Actinomycetota bacterium]|nr:hypothetical protein [Actinomycetota bacterium]